MALAAKVYEQVNKERAESSTEEANTQEDKKDDNVQDADYEEK